MDWIFDNFQIVAIIAIVLGSFVKQFFEAKAEERRAREEMERNPPDDVFGPDEEWETVPTAPPPLVKRATPPPLAQPPPLRRDIEAEEAVLKRQAEMQERLRLAREAKEAKAREAAAATKSTGVSAKSVRKAGLRGALADRAETRRAIVLREILGPPVGLR
jgi:type IV secretory pathway VirB10-like protein